MNERRDAVARDVGRPRPRYRDIPAHDLAEALGVPEPWQPGAGWSFTLYAKILTVEEFARKTFPASEVVYLIETCVDPKRFECLLELSEPLDSSDAPSFSFLNESEREALERVIAEEQLESNRMNGINCIAYYSVKSNSGESLEFEGDTEDDGSCIDLRTPYDKYARRFRDLSNCLTDSWSC